MTKLEALNLSLPLIDTYVELERQLLVNIAEQLGSGYGINSSTEWRIRQLARLGALNQENIAIITDSIGAAPELLTGALMKSAESTFDWLDISADEKKNLMQSIIDGNADTGLSGNMIQMLMSYDNQARDKLNQVNTVMQYKAESTYVDAVNGVWDAWSTEERREQAELSNKQEYINILNANTASVASGSMTKQEAVRQTIEQMCGKGIPAFIDSAGREWSPEAYISMVIRTTVNNTARETQFRYMRENGLDVIRISSHLNARPLCAPHQERLYSISNQTGYIRDIDGKMHLYEPLSSTSYGEPAGLFGINCGHFGFPVHEGAFFAASLEPTTDETEDDNEYKRAIEERELEWEVREHEIRAEAFEAVGDKEFAEIYRKKAREAQAQLEQWKKALTKGRSNGKIGDTDGVSELINITPVDITDTAAVKQELDSFIDNFKISDVEHALDISPDGNAYLVRGNESSVNSVNLVGANALKNSIGIHNHPIRTGLTMGDSFSYWDLLDAARYNRGMQYLVSGERQNAFVFTEQVTDDEIYQAWIEAEGAVLDKSMGGYKFDFMQVEILRELGRFLRGFKFYENI